MSWIDDVLSSREGARSWLDSVREKIDVLCDIYAAEGMRPEEVEIFITAWINTRQESGVFDFTTAELCRLYLDDWIDKHGEQ